MKKPLILVTNDDGIAAPGIKALVEAVCTVGNVAVVAPSSAQSGKSSAITAGEPIRLALHCETENLTMYACSGTPTDCVKMAINQILPQKPDLLVSGINLGPNSSISVIYSGTMGAAFEGCINRIPSFGISLCDFARDADFSHAADFAQKLSEKILRERLPVGVCLNVNVPKGKPRGARLCHQTDGYWVEEFVRRTDPAGKDYFWLSGYFNNCEKEHTQSDEFALENGEIAIVPCRVDMTDYDFLKNYTDFANEFKF